MLFLKLPLSRVFVFDAFVGDVSSFFLGDERVAGVFFISFGGFVGDLLGFFLGDERVASAPFSCSFEDGMLCPFNGDKRLGGTFEAFVEASRGSRPEEAFCVIGLDLRKTSGLSNETRL